MGFTVGTMILLLCSGIGCECLTFNWLQSVGKRSKRDYLWLTVKSGYKKGSAELKMLGRERGQAPKCVCVCVCVCLCVCLCVCVFALDEIRFLLPQQCGLNGRLTL